MSWRELRDRLVAPTEIVTRVTDYDSLRQTLLAHLAGRLEPHKVPRIVRFAQSIQSSQSRKKRRLDVQA